MYTVRRVLPYEYYKYTTHLKALDPEGRVFRFGIQIKDETIDALCNRIEANKDNHILFCVEDTNLEFIGIGHIALEDGMDLALSVLKEYRKQGIGSALISRCLQYCRTHNILTGKIICLNQNTPVKKLCAKHGIKLYNDQGETSGDIILDSPDLTAYINDQVANQRDIADFVIKRSPINLIKNLFSNTISYPTKL